MEEPWKIQFRHEFCQDLSVCKNIGTADANCIVGEGKTGEIKLSKEKTHLTDDLIGAVNRGVDNSLHAMSDSSGFDAGLEHSA